MIYKANYVCIEYMRIISHWGELSHRLMLSETLDSHRSAIVRWTVGDSQLNGSDQKTTNIVKLSLKEMVTQPNIYR